MEVTSLPEDVGLSPERLMRIRPWMQCYIDEGKLPGAAVMVARHGKVVYLELLGYRDLENQKPMTADTVLRFYSMTKPITSTALMMLYEKGLFQLDDPVAEFIPSFNNMQVYVSGSGADLIVEPLRQPMTIHHLLTHTSGLTYGFGNEGAIPELYQQHRTDFGTHDGSLEKVVERLAKIPLEFQPGERWNYGVSTDVLGRVVEVVSGQPLDAVFKEHIFEPLGMVDTGFAVPADRTDRFAVLYERTTESDLTLRESPQNSPMIDTVETFSGGGGLVCTLGDYFRFTEMLRRNGELDGVRLLGRKTVAYMTSNHLPGDLADMGQPTFNETTYEGIGFGLGFSVMLDPAKAGIKIDVVKKPADGYWDVVWLKEPWVMCYWNGRTTVDWMFSTAYSGDAKWNDTHWHNKRFDELLKAARAELDENKRAEMYFETQKICRDEGGTIVHMFEDWVIAANKKCKYENVAGNWNPDGAKAAERWWFES